MPKKNKKEIRIILAGGGTGGHLFPLIAVGWELKILAKSRGVVLKTMLLGDNKKFKNELIKENIFYKDILCGKFRRYLSVQNFFDLFKIFLGFFQALFEVWKFLPDVVFGKGGYSSFNVILVSWLLKRPIIIHESDSSSGLVNKVLKYCATYIAVSFPQTKKDFPDQKTALVGNPIRKELLQGSKEEAKKTFELSEKKPVILILGGSQGAKRINDAVFKILPELLESAEIIHSSGGENYEEFKRQIDEILKKSPLGKKFHLHSFLSESALSHAYAIADLIISRSGSGGIFEIAAVGKPSILIPLKGSARDHQRKNAYHYQSYGACAVVEEENLTENIFLKTILELLKDKARLDAMSQNARKFAKVDAGGKIAEKILELAKV